MENKLKTLVGRINKELKELNLPQKPANLYEPINYIVGLGGKRVRPMLALLAYKLYKPDVENIIAPVLALEVFHNFTLVHDDIMDQAPLRRGQPTVHAKWDSNIGILSGDVMLVKAYELLAQAPKDKLPVLLSKFNACATEVCEGQQKDMDFESRPSVSTQEYLEMIRQKTAVLLGFSLEMGAILAGAPKNECDLLYQVGVNLGLAFQLQDDLLDLYGGEAFGKQVGGDVINKKKTILITKALEETDEKETLINLYNTSIEEQPDKVALVTSAFDKLKLAQEVKQLIASYEKKGNENVNSLKSTFSKSTITSFINALKERTT